MIQKHIPVQYVMAVNREAHYIRENIVRTSHRETFHRYTGSTKSTAGICHKSSCAVRTLFLLQNSSAMQTHVDRKWTI